MRMFGAFDPIEPAVPGAPKATGTVNPDRTATLNWPVPDSGGSAITGYNIYRSIKGGPFTLIATVPVTNYTDASFAARDVYHVTGSKARVGIVGDWNSRDKGKRSALDAAIDIIAGDRRAAAVWHRPV